MSNAGIRTLDRWFSKYIRLRDADEYGYCYCCSCGRRYPWKETDAGHYINRSKYAVRYEEKNVHAQCRKCNRFTEGNVGAYTLFLVDRYGSEIIAMLQWKSKGPMKLCNYTVSQLTDYYKQAAKDRAAELGIKL